MPLQENAGSPPSYRVDTVSAGPASRKCGAAPLRGRITAPSAERSTGRCLLLIDTEGAHLPPLWEHKDAGRFSLQIARMEKCPPPPPPHSYLTSPSGLERDGRPPFPGRRGEKEGTLLPPPPPPPSSTARAASAGPDGSVRCSYCASPGQQVAVKTCLVCGASMCATHLRHHLESPEFQAHPLVAPVADVSAWRCAEHQEAKKIYCRDCAACVCTVCTVIGAHRDHACVGVAEAEGQLRGSLRDDMKKMKENEEVIRSRVASLQEKEQNIQETLDQSRDSLRQQYQAMREALDRQELMALQVVDREERRVLGGVQAQLELLQEELRSIQTSLDTLEGLSNSKGAERVKGQAFIMEYSKISESVTAMSSPLGELEPLQEVDRARLGQLEEWAERRLKALFLQATMDRDALRLL
ncbi:hypothetical protein ANANG_G00110090 [Anguilla anguilla]|uniref:B box-type domain-containing protein n=1 Tax=Anguilla anguilla TaxID=7936 RepID=A0A9D3MID4_ANGAN|nr:hypothetical protein ANANG_G00110090 [Anguilla anguilla]